MHPQNNQYSQSPLAFKDILGKLHARQTLGPGELHDSLIMMMEGAVSDLEIAAFLMGLGPENESIDHIVEAARALREKAMNIEAPEGTVDCCGTGGDSLKTLNISTAVAIVSAACGVPVAKHGNRAASSQSGAADILEALDLKLLEDPAKLEKALKNIGFAFLMAPHHHTSMANVSKIRKALGFRTLFNILGPLSNPAGTKIQLVGVYDRAWLIKIAEALGKLGAEKALVVHGHDGLDEITLTGKTFCAEWTGNDIVEYILTPDDFGLPGISIDDIRGGSPENNAQALSALLGGAQGAYRNITLANCAALLKLAGKCESLKEGVGLAAKAIDNGEAMAILNDYKEL